MMRKSRSKLEINAREIRGEVLLSAFEIIIFIDLLCEYRRYI